MAKQAEDRFSSAKEMAEALADYLRASERVKTEATGSMPVSQQPPVGPVLVVPGEAAATLPPPRSMPLPSQQPSIPHGAPSRPPAPKQRTPDPLPGSHPARNYPAVSIRLIGLGTAALLVWGLSLGLVVHRLFFREPPEDMQRDSVDGSPAGEVRTGAGAPVSNDPAGTAPTPTISAQPKAFFLRGHTGAVRSATLSSDGRKIVTASDDHTAQVWDADLGNEIAILRGHTDKVWGASFSTDGSQVVTASYDHTARIWDAASGKQLAVLEGHEDWVHSASFSRDGRRVVTASQDKTARVWDLVAGSLWSESAVLEGHSDGVLTASFTGDGKRVVTGSLDATARVWNLETEVEPIRLEGHTQAILWATFSPDGRRVLTTSMDKTARVWDAVTGKELARLVGHQGGIEFGAFSSDGLRIVTGSYDRTVRVWAAGTGKPIATLEGHQAVVLTTQYGGDSRIRTAAWAGSDPEAEKSVRVIVFDAPP
jgi:WD40 repeat protein